MLALDAVGLDQVLPIELDHLLLQLRLAQRGADLAVWVAETEEILLLGTGRLQQHIGERILAGADEVLLRWWTELPFDCLHRKLGPAWPCTFLEVCVSTPDMKLTLCLPGPVLVGDGCFSGDLGDSGEFKLCTPWTFEMLTDCWSLAKSKGFGLKLADWRAFAFP